jgi:hypothetical protein
LLLPLQGEGWDGDGVDFRVYKKLKPIPTLTLPLKGRGFLANAKIKPDIAEL